ncbi:MAG: PKD domain-containing protein [Lentisphaeria bacterium]|nr:PKD domain-containing protein [Lentisphaeria bacterium]
MKKSLLLLLLCFLGVWAILRADDISEHTAKSASVRIDARTSVGGRILHGEKVDISPVAENENKNARLSIDNRPAEGWTVAKPEYDSTQLTRDGWYAFSLNEGAETATAKLLALNDEEIEIHGGALKNGDETWEKGKIHIVRNWVRIPQGVTLTVKADAVVKFCENTGIQVDGTIITEKGSIFTSIADDAAGDHDTDMETAEIGYGLYDITGDGDKSSLSDCDIRCAASLPVNTTWASGQVVHVMGVLRVPSGVTLTIQSGAIVKFATGAELKAEGNNNITANGALFTHIADDSDEAGGDTNGDGDATSPVHDAYKLPTAFVPDIDGKDQYGNEIRYITPQPYTGGTIGSGVTKTLGGNRVHKVTGNITIASGGKLIVQPGAVVKMNAGLSITVNSGGTLEALGNRAQPIVFTSIKDDAHGGDTNGDEDETEPQPGDWGRIYAGGTVNMNYVTISYLNNNSDQGAIQGSGGTVTFDNGVIEYSVYECVRMNSGSFIARNSVFREASMGFGYYGGSGTRCINCVITEVTVGCRSRNKYFTNCVFYRVKNITDQSGDSSSFQNCVFYNPADFGGAHSYVKVDSNGNIWGDPLFTDAANGDYSLKAGSPCIDAGDGTAAPEFDYWGKPRMDVVKVADSGKPNDDGACPDIGIYEMPGAYTGACANLTVSSVTAPAAATSGKEITVSWTITNEGNDEANGTWRDVVVLQGDDELGGQIVTLGEATVTTTLVPLDSIPVERKFTLPPLKAGNWRVGVTTNAYRDVYEVKRADNQSFAEETTAVTLPVWSSSNNRFTVGGYGETGFALPKSNSARIVTITLPGGAKMSAYGADGYLPSGGNSDVKSVTLANGKVVLVVPAGAEEAYVTLVNEGGSSATATVSVANATLSLLEATPAKILNRGTSTMRVIGTGLSADSVFKLSMGSTTVTGAMVSLEDGLVAAVQFDVNGIAPGNYTLSVTEGGRTASLSGKINVTADGIGPKLEAWLETPPSVRDGRIYTAWLCYKNSGDADMTMPLFEVSCNSTTKLSYTVDGEYASRPLRYAGISPTAPAGVLKAGEENRVPVFFTLKGSYKLNFATISQNDMDHSTFGTWAEYAQAMAQAATRLNARGREEYRGTVLFGQALKEKNGQPCSAISGYVRTIGFGEPVSGVTVLFSNQNGETFNAVSDDSGFFSVSGLVSDTYDLGTVNASLPDDENHQINLIDGLDVNGYVVNVVKLPSISGWVTAEDTGVFMSDVPVRLKYGSLVVKETLTDIEGHYLIENVLPGEYTVQLCGIDGYAEERANVNIPENSAGVSCDFIMKCGAVVHASVLCKGETVMLEEGANVVAYAQDSTVYQAYMEADGTFTFAGLPEGAYTFDVQSMKYKMDGEIVKELASGDVVEVEMAVSEAAIFMVMPPSGSAPHKAKFSIANELYDSEMFAYAWDFNGDGKVDSRERTPEYTYTSPGEYTVSVVVTKDDGTICESVSVNCVSVREKVENVPKSTVLVLPDGKQFAFVSYSQGNLVLRQVTSTASLNPGNATAVVCYDASGNVLARVIDNAVKEGSLWRLSTSPASLDDLFDSYDITAVSEGGDGSGTRDGESDSRVSWKVGVNGVGNDITGSLYPTISYDAVRTAYGKKTGHQLVVGLKGNLIQSSQISISASLNFSKELAPIPIMKPKVIFTIPLGPVPIPVSARIDVKGVLDGQFYGKASVTSTHTEHISTYAGISWSKQSEFEETNLSFVKDFSHDSSDDVTLSLEGGFNLSFNMMATARIYVGLGEADVAGAELSIGPYISVEATCSTESADFNVYVGVKATFGISFLDVIEFLGLPVDLGAEWTLLDLKFGVFSSTAPTYKILAHPTSGDEPLDVHFSVNPFGAWYPMVYNWDFGDGRTYTIDKNENFTHRYGTKGTYTASLLVRDKKFTNERAKSEVTIKVGDDDDDNPPPEEEPTEDETGNPVQSCDPNEISGVIGLGDGGTQRFVKPGEWLDYTVYFENKSTAAAPAQQVWVTHNLSKWLDWSTLELGEIAFNNQIQLELKGKARGTAMVPQTGTNYHVQMNAAMDEATGEFQLYLRSYDKTRQAYGYWPESVYAGFLPPNDSTHRGEGHFTFRVKVRDDAPDSAFINAEATIVFDYNDPITTSPAWFNWVTTAESPVADATTLHWDTSDDANGTTYVVNYWMGDPDPTAPETTITFNSDTLTTGSWKLPDGLAVGTWYWNVTKTKGDNSSKTSTWSFDILATHTLTVNGGIGSGSYRTNTRVTVEANAVEGKKFTGWTAVGLEMSEAELSESRLVFYMPDNDVTLTANYEEERGILLLPGWNLVATPGELLEEDNAELFAELKPFVLSKESMAYIRAALPLHGGEPLWIYSARRQQVPFVYEDANGVVGGLTDKVGWQLIGVGGKEAITLYNVIAAWEWSIGGWRPLEINGGKVSLKAGYGYFIYKE